MFLVHRLVQDVTRRGLELAGRTSELLTQTLAWVNAAFLGDPQDVRSGPRLNPLAPHGEAVAGFADTAGIADPTARLFNQLGMLFLVKALHARAEPLMRRVVLIVLIFQRDTGHPHPHCDAALGNYAILLQAMGRSEAEITDDVQAVMREAGLA